MRKDTALVCLAALSGCISAPALTTAPRGKSLAVQERIDFPDVGNVSEARLGEEIIRQGTYTEMVGIELPRPNKIEAYKLSAGFYPQFAEDENYTYHSYRTRPARGGYGYIPPARDPVFADLMKAPAAIRAAKHKQETCVIVRDFLTSACDTEYPYQRITRTELSQADLQQKLVYRGRHGDRIVIGYNEASGHYARPEFSQETEYDLGQSDEIAYKGARIKVLQADDTAIRYQVLAKLRGW